mmetsp:Transcript_38593/g.60212  ORF Transcript_38593/g.60212 Transcript_38593/m.60212 type:complete len:254 (-) Transcript_38593:147-908(-)
MCGMKMTDPPLNDQGTVGGVETPGQPRDPNSFRSIDPRRSSSLSADSELSTPSAVGLAPGGVVALRSPAFASEELTPLKDSEVVNLDYNSRRQGFGDVADRGSALLQLASRWQEEEEEVAAARAHSAPDSTPKVAKRKEVWQRVQGTFLAVGALNTEKISAPYVHMSDGCMDVIAVPAELEFMDVLDMLPKVSSGGHVTDRRLFHWKASHMRFYPADTADKFNVDGEVLDGHPISIQVLPAFARLLSIQKEED